MSEIKTISVKDKNYPKLLKEIKNPPEVLYYRGELNPDEKCFGVVGTRMFSSYGKQVVLEIAGDLAEAGLTIVSGLAPELILSLIPPQLKEEKEQLRFWGQELMKEVFILSRI